MPGDTLPGALNAAKELALSVKDTEAGAEAVDQLGSTALTVTKTINNVLLPIAIVNFAFDKARDYFDSKFASDLAKATKDIPPDQIKEPKASAVAPVLQGLSFGHEEPSLKQLYLNLLRSAMDARLEFGDHPSFSEIVRQLSAAEANILLIMLGRGPNVPICEIRLSKESGSHEIIARNIVDLRSVDGTPKVVSRIAVMVDNWARLGLINIDQSSKLTAPEAYAWIDERPEFKWLREKHKSEGSVEPLKHIFRVTDFGLLFYEAVK